jgi:hypothetical protein
MIPGPACTRQSVSLAAHSRFGCRVLFDNRFEGPVPPSLFEMLTPDGLKYALYCCTVPAAHDACTQPMSSRALGRCSLFPQGGCLLEPGTIREGQEENGRSFGQCVPRPVSRCSASVPFARSHRRYTDAPFKHAEVHMGAREKACVLVYERYARI